MNQKSSWLLIIFSIMFLLLVGVYWSARERGWILSRPQSGSPLLAPLELTAEEKELILSTLGARQKENLTPQQKTRILNSLTAP